MHNIMYIGPAIVHFLCIQICMNCEHQVIAGQMTQSYTKQINPHIVCTLLLQFAHIQSEL